MLNLGHTLDQLKIIQINLDLKAIATRYQMNYPGKLKPSQQLSIVKQNLQKLKNFPKTTWQPSEI